MKPSMRPIHIPLSPCYTRGTISALLHSRDDLRLARETLSGPPRARQTISASLEGSGSTLEQVSHLRLARGHPSAQGTNSPAAQPLAVRRH